MSLQYLSGVKRQAKKTARIEKKAVKKEAKMSPVTKTRVNKLQVQSKIRKTFVKKAEPIKVEEEEIIKEQEQPADYQTSEETPEETKAEVEETQAEEEQADMGIYYPNFGKVKIPKLKGKLKEKVNKAKKGIKEKVNKAKQRRKDDKHKPLEKAEHLLAKEALLIPRGAFLAIILLGKALENTFIKINIGKKLAAAYPSQKKKINEFWYKVGGEPDILESQINKFKQSSVSGYLGVDPVTDAAVTATTASPLITQFLKIIKQGAQFAKDHPQIMAQGQAIAKKGIEDAIKKNPEQAKNANLVADQITKVLPADQQAKINEIRKNIPKSTTDKNIKNAVTQIKTILPKSLTTNPTPSNNKNILLIGGGAVAILGAYLLMKKK